MREGRVFFYGSPVAEPPATRRQALTAATLTSLGRPLLRQLCQVILAERGLRVVRVQPRADLDDLYADAQVIWRARSTRVRLLHRPLVGDDVLELSEVARADALAEAVLVEGAPGDQGLPEQPGVDVIRAARFVELIRTSALVEWVDGQPRPALDRLALAYDLSEIAVALDPVGLRWLPTLSLNQVPAELDGHGSADELFEAITFRLLTMALRLGGRRLGARRRGERLPDALIWWSEDAKVRAALLDCKAAQYGYRMGIDDQRALIEYFVGLRSTQAEAGRDLDHVVIVSSDFEGEPGERHPYHRRASALAEEAGAKLTYLRASDLVRLLIAVERDRADPAQREAIRWGALFDLGMPASSDVAETWPPEG